MVFQEGYLIVYTLKVTVYCQKHDNILISREKKLLIFENLEEGQWGSIANVGSEFGCENEYEEKYMYISRGSVFLAGLITLSPPLHVEI